LPRDVADALKPFLASKQAGSPIWPGRWPNRAFRLIQIDLEAARKKWLAAAREAHQDIETSPGDFLAYQDSAGRFADFHALRHSYITMVGKTGVTPKEHQQLARHGSYALTSKYTHARFYDLATAVNALPSIVADKPDRALAATGTDGDQGANLGPNLGPPGRLSMAFNSLQQPNRAGGPRAQNPGNNAKNQSFSRSGDDAQKHPAAGLEPAGAPFGDGARCSGVPFRSTAATVASTLPAAKVARFSKLPVRRCSNMADSSCAYHGRRPVRTRGTDRLNHERHRKQHLAGKG
jgi:hypothetical protein